jgi:signal transduction histidine kinase
MKIRTKLWVTTSISITMAVVVGAATFFSLRELDAVRTEVTLIQTLQKEVADLRSTTFEYLTYHEQRMYLQWQSKDANITKLLDGLQDEHKEADTLIGEIRENHKNVNVLFDMMTGPFRENGGNGALLFGGSQLDPSARERETILGGQLLIRTQYILSGLLRLSAHTSKVMKDAQERMALAVVLSILLLVAVVAVASLTITKSLVKPIDRLRRGTERVGTGDLDFRVGTDRDDEIGDLARSFDRMAGALSEKEAQLRQRAEQLEATNQELEAFSYSVSHDLRAPLRHVSGYIDLLKRKIGPQLDEKGRHYIEMIVGSGEKMGRLIDDLLAFSRMGRTEMRLAPVSLGDLIQEVQKELRGEARNRKIAWQIDPLPQVVADASMLRLAVTNLLSNAIKFTRDGPG